MANQKTGGVILDDCISVSCISLSPETQIFLTFRFRDKRRLSSGVYLHWFTGGIRCLGSWTCRNLLEAPYDRLKIKHVDGSIAPEYDSATQINLA